MDENLIKRLKGDFTEKQLQIIKAAFESDHSRHQIEFDKLESVWMKKVEVRDRQIEKFNDDFKKCKKDLKWTFERCMIWKPVGLKK